MEESFLQLSIADLLRFKMNLKSYQDKLVIVKMDGNNHRNPGFKEDVSIRLDAFSIFLVRQGDIEITIDDFTYHLSDNLLLNIMDMHSVKNFRLGLANPRSGAVPRQAQPGHRISRAHHRPCEQERQPYP